MRIVSLRDPRLFTAAACALLLLSACHSGGDAYEPGGADEWVADYEPDEYESESREDVVEDGTHTATVDYYNPETGYSATYDLDVEVEDGEVVEIQFPNGGYLDEYRLSNTELDEDGSADVEDDEGRSFHIEIDP